VVLRRRAFAGPWGDSGQVGAWDQREWIRDAGFGVGYRHMNPRRYKNRHMHSKFLCSHSENDARISKHARQRSTSIKLKIALRGGFAPVQGINYGPLVPPMPPCPVAASRGFSDRARDWAQDVDEAGLAGGHDFFKSQFFHPLSSECLETGSDE